MRPISIIPIALAMLFGGSLALAQTAQTQAEVKAARDRLTVDQKTLEAAYKSKDLPRIKAAEDKVRASEGVLRQKRGKASAEKAQSGDQAKLKADRAALAKDREQLSKDRAALEAARKSGDAAKTKAAEDQLRASRQDVRSDRRQLETDRGRPGRAERGERSGKGKSGWAHSEKKGYGRDKDR